MTQMEPTLVDDGPALARAGLVHRVLEPSGAGPHPTVVMLHGKSGNEDVMWIFARHTPPGWLLVAPRALLSDPDGGYSWRLREEDDWPSLSDFDTAVAETLTFIHSLPELYGADLDRLYLMGFSQGAALSYAIAMRYPDLVQGVAGLVGFVPMHCDDFVTAGALEGKPIFMAVGTRDDRIPYERSLACAQTLNLAGADLDYHEYAMGHRLNAEAMRDLRAWWQARAAAVNGSSPR